jgi:hypothetical protein
VAGGSLRGPIIDRGGSGKLLTLGFIVVFTCIFFWMAFILDLHGFLL